MAAPKNLALVIEVRPLVAQHRGRLAEWLGAALQKLLHGFDPRAVLKIVSDMKFKTPCFVRVENAEERNKLLEWCLFIGYFRLQIPREEQLSKLVICDGECTGIVNNPTTFSLEMVYEDCGTDIELFKALAAMNDENDREQWYIITVDVYYDWPQGHMFKCQPHPSEWHVGTSIDPMYCRKATAEEIIKYFKKDEKRKSKSIDLREYREY